MKIKALNEPDASNSTSGDSCNDTDGKRQQNLSHDVALEQSFEKYRLALLSVQELKETEARDLLDELLEELNQFDSDEDAIAQLKFSVLKNLGNLDADNIEHYINALGIDPTDICLWIKAGERATRLNNYNFARLCYEQALDLNPTNWMAIDKLTEVYYILHLPLELYDICMQALALNHGHQKSLIFLEEARKLQPFSDKASSSPKLSGNVSQLRDNILGPLELVKKRRRDTQDEVLKFKRARLSIILDTARTQSLVSFGNYMIKIYERFAKQGITRNSVIDITLNNTLSFTHQFSNCVSTAQNSQSNNQNSSEAQTTSCSQDIEMAIGDGDGTSISDTDKSSNRNDPPNNSEDGNETTTRSNGKNRNSQSQNNSQNNGQVYQKGSSLSFAAMLFPMDMGDKRRSSRNRSNQDDTFSFKMKFDELNELLPESLRIGAIEQVLQKRRKEQQKDDAPKDGSKEEPVLIETNLEPIREDLIIKDIVGAISALNTNGDVKLCKMFYVYLSKLSSKKQNTLPDAFLKIYKIYRRLCPLPGDVFIEIGPRGLEIDEIWFTLTANEISYQPQECPLLLRILEQLRMHLDESQHREFLVRLSVVLGLNYNHQYLDVALQNIEEDTRVYASNRKIITRAYIKTLIERINEKLQQEGEDPDDSLELIKKLAPKSESEMSDREISSLCTAIKSAGVWQQGLDIINQRNDLNLDVIMNTINECLKNGAKMDAILASKLCKDAISGARPTTWTCLFRGWSNLLTREEFLDGDTVSRMDRFFELGHQTLGKRCTCTSDNGEFLMLYVGHLIEEGDNLEERELLGALSCLFGYPTKRPTSVVGHKASRVPMQWQYAEIIYQYLAPEELPTYMSLLRKVGITNELELVFKEIASSIPEDLHPIKQVSIIERFIDSGAPIEGLTLQPGEVTRDVFYFLADYYFKNKDFATAKQFYHHDLVINPTRFDSWAASGLIRANIIDKALSEGAITTKDFVDGSFHDLVDSTIRCLEQATSLKPDEPKATLWIEFGNLTYNLTALATRLYTYDGFEEELEGPNTIDYTKLDARHKYLYSLAEKCFKSANTLCKSEEIWLHYYMLGKIHEKMDTFKALKYYFKADAQLFLEGASYPKKISYHNPPELAYEAMEVHYRIHASALKFLLTTHDINQGHMNKLKRILLSSQRSPFVELEGAQNPKSHVRQPTVIERDVSLVLYDLITDVSCEAEFDELVFMCLHGMKRCLVRCDKNFKALYRLAYYYHKIRDSRMAQDILLVKELKTDRRILNLLTRKPGIPEFQAAPPDLQGVDTLFKDRKHGNLFFNIWRIPVEEVDRPGSFEHWMFKCTWLLIRTSVNLGDTNVLSMIAFQLSRQPETSKKYLQDRARVLLANFATKSIVDMITQAVEECDNLETKRHYVREGMALADRFIKANVFAEKMRDLFNRLHIHFSNATEMS